MNVGASTDIFGILTNVFKIFKTYKIIPIKRHSIACNAEKMLTSPDKGVAAKTKASWEGVM